MASSQTGLSNLPAGATQRSKIQLESSIIGKLRQAKVFKDAVDHHISWTSTAHEGYSAAAQITSIAFDPTGELCVTASEDEAFSVWDATRGKLKNNYYSRKYGISLIRFTHRGQNILHTSTKGDHDIRYHSTHDNKYLQYYKGHTARVRSIHMHPTKDAFISAGDDGTVRIWDLRNQKCQSLLNNVGGSTIAAFDETGRVFVVACSELSAIMLYGTADADVTPFHWAQFHDMELARISQPPRRPIFTSIAFSGIGKQIVLGTSSDVHYILDAFNLSIQCRLVGHQGLETDTKGNRDLQPRRGGSGEEVGWTADSRWIYSGSSDGNVYFWDLSVHPPWTEAQRDSGISPQTLPPTYKIPMAGPIRSVQFNPRYAMLAVGGEDLSFLLPEREEKIEDGW